MSEAGGIRPSRAEAASRGWWRFTDRDEVEFGNEPGGSLAAVFGPRISLDAHGILDIEAQIIGQIVPLHGRNDIGEEIADDKFFGSRSPTMLVITSTGGRYRASKTITFELGGRCYYWALPVAVDGARPADE